MTDRRLEVPQAIFPFNSSWILPFTWNVKHSVERMWQTYLKRTGQVKSMETGRKRMKGNGLWTTSSFVWFRYLVWISSFPFQIKKVMPWNNEWNQNEMRQEAKRKSWWWWEALSMDLELMRLFPGCHLERWGEILVERDSITNLDPILDSWSNSMFTSIILLREGEMDGELDHISRQLNPFDDVSCFSHKNMSTIQTLSSSTPSNRQDKRGKKSWTWLKWGVNGFFTPLEKVVSTSKRKDKLKREKLSERTALLGPSCLTDVVESVGSFSCASLCLLLSLSLSFFLSILFPSCSQLSSCLSLSLHFLFTLVIQGKAVHNQADRSSLAVNVLATEWIYR